MKFELRVGKSSNIRQTQNKQRFKIGCGVRDVNILEVPVYEKYT
jgi:hypothetical protein